MLNGIASETKIIRGTPANFDEYPFVFTGQFITCGMTKIAPKSFLTAAHCVARSQFDEKLLGSAIPGRAFPIVVGRMSNLIRNIKIEKVDVHENWKKQALILNDYASKFKKGLISKDEYIETETFRTHLDLAVIHVDKETHSLPALPLSFQEIDFNQEVSMLGYGCSDDSGVGFGHYRRGNKQSR